jgi:hypothetical protein
MSHVVPRLKSYFFSCDIFVTTSELSCWYFSKEWESEKSFTVSFLGRSEDMLWKLWKLEASKKPSSQTRTRIYTEQRHPRPSLLPPKWIIVRSHKFPFKGQLGACSSRKLRKIEEPYSDPVRSGYRLCQFSTSKWTAEEPVPALSLFPTPPLPDAHRDARERKQTWRRWASTFNF